MVCYQFIWKNVGHALLQYKTSELLEENQLELVNVLPYFSNLSLFDPQFFYVNMAYLANCYE